MSKTFVKGAQEMIYGGLLIGFASAISVVLTKGNIMHTIIYSLSKPLAWWRDDFRCRDVCCQRCLQYFCSVRLRASHDCHADHGAVADHAQPDQHLLPPGGAGASQPAISMSALDVTRSLPGDVTSDMDLALWQAAKTILKLETGKTSDGLDALITRLKVAGYDTFVFENTLLANAAQKKTGHQQGSCWADNSVKKE
jgi:hypothetical protein